MFPLESRILIVDDDSGALAHLKEVLGQLGYTRIFDFRDGDTAYTHLGDASATEDPYQLVISDLNMAPLSGKELLRFVRSNPLLLNLPFIMLTSDGKLSAVVEAIHEGVSDYVVKPVDKDTLARKLANAYAKHKVKA